MYFNVTFEDCAILTIIESNSTVKHLSENTFVVKSKFNFPDLDEVFNGTVTMRVCNRFGSQIESYKIVEGTQLQKICTYHSLPFSVDIIDTFYMCSEEVTPSTTTTVISSNTVLSSVNIISSIHYSTLLVTISPGKQTLFVFFVFLFLLCGYVVSINPPPASSNGRVRYHIYIPVGIAVFVLLLLVVAVLCIIICLKVHKDKLVLIVTG